MQSFPFTDKAKSFLGDLNYQSRDYSKGEEVNHQSGEFDPGTKNIFVDTGNSKIPADQQKIVMAHEMLNAIFPQSLAGTDSKGFNSIWEDLKINGDSDTKQLLKDIDDHMKALGYQNIKNNGDTMTSSRFSYLGQETTELKSLPVALQKYYKDYIK